MAVLPIDLQVLFSKSTEHQENVARHSNAVQTGQLTSIEKVHKESIQTNERVQSTEQYAQDFTKVHPDRKGGAQFQTSSQRKNEGKKEEQKETYRPAAKEEGKGIIIDIVE